MYFIFGWGNVITVVIFKGAKLVIFGYDILLCICSRLVIEVRNSNKLLSCSCS